MTKITIKYENDMDKIKILELLSKGTKIIEVRKPYKSGKYYRVYVDIE
ncbi:hypothetical protein [Clostridium botulinum]|nr:hypothetical protein [Clostridium botulinum]MBY6836275.1 hypothetical protein [Clostridium botulinum]